MNELTQKTHEIFKPKAAMIAYVCGEEYNKNYPTDLQAIAVEMEAAILFALASHLQKEAACILTVVDSMYDPQVVTPEERQNSLNDMILCALETI